MDGKFIVLRFLFVNCWLMEVGLATSKAQSLPSDFGTSDISFPECVHKIHGEAGQHRRNSLGNSKSCSEPDGRTEGIEHEVSLSGGLSISSDRGSIHKSMVEQQSQIDHLEEYFDGVVKNGDLSVSFHEIKRRASAPVENGNYAFLDAVVESFWVAKRKIMNDLMNAKSQKNEEGEKRSQSTLDALVSLTKDYQNGIASTLNGSNGSIRLEVELERLSQTLETLVEEIAYYR